MVKKEARGINDMPGKIRFTKMHGAGNDYIYIDATIHVPDSLPYLARCISERHLGVGADGLVAIMSSETADFRMRMFNADGSEAQMCGNASRCIGKFVYERGLTAKTEITLETLAGIRLLKLHVQNGIVKNVTVDMGMPELRHDRVPVAASPLEEGMVEILVNDRRFSIYPVSMGNPHGVIFCDSLPDSLVLGFGAKLECNPIWPAKANIEFCRIISPELMEMRVWERGSGETMACGTGACAALVAAVSSGLMSRKATLRLRGGDLSIHWDEDSGHVLMTGGAEFIADGDYYIPCAEQSIRNF